MCYTGLVLGLFWNLILHWLVLGPNFLKQHFGILYYTGLILGLLEGKKHNILESITQLEKNIL